MRKQLLTVLHYFGYFSYAPSFEEIHTFFPQKISKKNLQILLIKEVSAKMIVRLPKKTENMRYRPSEQHILNLNFELAFPRYTLPQYSILLETKFKLQIQILDKKAPLTIQRYIEVLKILPFIRFVGVTGASAMNGLQNNDDFDLCIVSKHKLLWTTRFFIVIAAKMLRIHHQNGAGVCLNLFFDESDLVIPHAKNNSYIAHELLQMKPIIDKNHIYQQFLAKNEWIYRYFPNAPSVIPAKAGIQPINFNSKRIIFDWIPSSEGMTQIIDLFFKSLQLPIIKKNRTGFRITDHQLWLFKQDFEKKLRRKGLGK